MKTTFWQAKKALVAPEFLLTFPIGSCKIYTEDTNAILKVRALIKIECVPDMKRECINEEQLQRRRRR
jgi:hypothetical protein